MKSSETYILFSNSLNRFYVGQTSNFTERFERHNKSMVKSTKRGTPWKLVVKFEVASRRESLALEKKIKGRGAKRYIEDNSIKFGM
ncbi:MAG: GIY-YIG nuclease family protein [Flavobacteriales bacterium]|nr:GIY-YIG nuclease family protein [Flavobacteriales bacterium]